MLIVLLLALGSSACAAGSTVLKHYSAQSEGPPRWATPLPDAVARMIVHPAFAAAIVCDVLAVLLQISALRFGNLSVVQPVLSAALIMSLALTHAVNRTRPSKPEILWSALLVGGLVLFLTASGATAPEGAASIGALNPGIVLALCSTALIALALFGTRRMRPAARARVLAVAVAGIYATTAALMKSIGHIESLHGRWAVLSSWQLWVLISVAALGLVLNQVAFSAAPLRVTLPIIASLDPLFSILIGMCVYSEALRTSPLAISGETLGLGALLVAVVGLSLQGTQPREGDPNRPELAASRVGQERSFT